MWCAFLITVYLAFKASASQIIGHGDRSAEYSEDAHYKCKLDDPKDVVQVTWQRVYKDDPIENLATYSGSMTLAVTVRILVALGSVASACGDAAVSCALQQSCVLPCSFDPGPDPEMYWTKEPGDKTPVHYYIRGRNQPQYQHQNFRGRTSLFEESLSTGNASLRLSGVKVQDEGKYKCYANTLKTHITTELYVDVTVYAAAPVSLQPQGQQLLCSSEGVYPKPSVSWSPPSLGPEPQTSVNVSEDGLYLVSSSLSVPLTSASNYTCNISTPYWWRAETIRPQIEEGGSNLKYLWILTVLILIPVCYFIYCIYKKIIQKVRQSKTPSHKEEDQDVREALKNGSAASKQHENGRCHGNHTETSL